jgi:hypothetical protein
VLVAAASESSAVPAILAGRYVSIGAESAVAMDGNGSIMFGSGAEVIVQDPRPRDWPFRQAIQKYGFYCH